MDKQYLIVKGKRGEEEQLNVRINACAKNGWILEHAYCDNFNHYVYMRLDAPFEER